MKEWKLIGIASLAVNVLMVGLLFTAVFIVQGIVEDKNQAITTLKGEVSQLKEDATTAIATTTEASTTEEKPEEILEEALTEEVKQPVTQNKTANSQKEPVQQQDYKQKLLSYKASLNEDFETVYFLYEGSPDVEFLLAELSNAEVRAMYEESYQVADQVLNKVYGILKNTLPAAQFNELQTEQRAWLNQLNQSKEARLAMGGSSAGIDVAVDMGMKTQERCLKLMMEYFDFKSIY